MPSLYRVEQDRKTTQRNEDHAHLSSKEVQLRRFAQLFPVWKRKNLGKILIEIS